MVWFQEGEASYYACGGHCIHSEGIQQTRAGDRIEGQKLKGCYRGSPNYTFWNYTDLAMLSSSQDFFFDDDKLHFACKIINIQKLVMSYWRYLNSLALIKI